MGRKPRIEFNGAIYHVIQRGNNKEYIFRKADYKKYFLNKIKEINEIMDFKIYGYVLMDNHYHIIIKCYEDGISRIMHKINNDFSKYFNCSNHRSGHVFQERFKGILVKDDKYLLSLLRYVHQNPVKANMCNRVSDYKWSSDYLYRNNKQKQFVHIDFILNIFSCDRNKAIAEYIKFMDADEMEESAEFEYTDIIGDVKIQKKETEILSLDDILNEVTENNEELICKIKNGSRVRELTNYKKLYIQKALSYKYSMNEIGNNIGISDAAVCKLANKE